jgi:hypothetical protein
MPSSALASGDVLIAPWLPQCCTVTPIQPPASPAVQQVCCQGEGGGDAGRCWGEASILAGGGVMQRAHTHASAAVRTQQEPRQDARLPGVGSICQHGGAEHDAASDLAATPVPATCFRATEYLLADTAANGGVQLAVSRGG